MGIVIIRDTGFEGQEKHVRWRTADGAASAYQQADLTSLKYDAVSMDDTSEYLAYVHDGGTTANDVALAITSDNPPAEGEIYISDTALTTEGWSEDSTGWTCKVIFPKDLFETADDNVRIEVFAQPSAAGADQIVFAVIEIQVAGIVGG